MQNISLAKTRETNKGRTLEQASFDKPVLLVFLRHFGCVFCIEAMRTIGKQKAEWEAKNINIILVHMSDNETAEQYFQKYLPIVNY
jgi:thiol-disulfide isomerase/thioredoxin